MDELERHWLAEFSAAVRESTMKRLRTVPDGLENWAYQAGKMTFADLAWHLIECDRWMFRTLLGERLAPVQKSQFTVKARRDFEQLLEGLWETGEKRMSLIRSFAHEDFRRIIHDPRAGKKVTTWWLLVRGNLDHEIHHRGQLSVYLSLAEAVRHKR